MHVQPRPNYEMRKDEEKRPTMGEDYFGFPLTRLITTFFCPFFQDKQIIRTSQTSHTEIYLQLLTNEMFTKDL